MYWTLPPSGANTENSSLGTNLLLSSKCKLTDNCPFKGVVSECSSDCWSGRKPAFSLRDSSNCTKRCWSWSEVDDWLVGGAGFVWLESLTGDGVVWWWWVPWLPMLCFGVDSAAACCDLLLLWEEWLTPCEGKVTYRKNIYKGSIIYIPQQ